MVDVEGSLVYCVSIIIHIQFLPVAKKSLNIHLLNGVTHVSAAKTLKACSLVDASTARHSRPTQKYLP